MTYIQKGKNDLHSKGSNSKKVSFEKTNERTKRCKVWADPDSFGGFITKKLFDFIIFQKTSCYKIQPKIISTNNYEQFLRKTVGPNYTIILVVGEHAFLNACYNTQSTKILFSSNCCKHIDHISKTSNFCKHTDHISKKLSTVVNTDHTSKKLSTFLKLSTVVNTRTRKNCCKQTDRQNFQF
jgi:hypothetical protein